MYVGVIYCYTSPTKKKYIGKTINEEQRKADFRCMVKPYTYGISKIERARQKYGWEAFDYEVLERVENDDKEKLNQKLIELETAYIKFYDTYNNGYNSTEGGEGVSRNKTDEEKARISQILKQMNHKPNEIAHIKAKEALQKSVIQMDKNGNVLAEYPSIADASKATGTNRQSISDICRGAIKMVNGKPYQRKTAGGYYWKFNYQIIKYVRHIKTS